MQRHFIVERSGDGGFALHPLKEWLRQHPGQVPPGMDATSSTSHDLRRGLLKAGWSKQESETEFRLIPPGDRGDFPNVAEDLTDTVAADIEDESAAPYFSLEYQLRDFLASNLPSFPINGKRLRVFVDQAGRDGVEYPSAVGPIDILAVDAQGSFYVFELKRATSPDRALGQLARYMGWVSGTIAKGQVVQGVIVGKAISDNLRWARQVVPNVHLFEYEVSFALKAVAS